MPSNISKIGKLVVDIQMGDMGILYFPDFSFITLSFWLFFYGYLEYRIICTIQRKENCILSLRFFKLFALIPGVLVAARHTLNLIVIIV